MDYNGLCIKGCPPRHEIAPSGKCEFKDYNKQVNSKYFIVALIIIVSVGLLIAAYMIYKKYFVLLPYVEIQSHLAVSLAKINNLNEDRIQKDIVEIGVGTDPENINDWINEIWLNYVKKDDKVLRKVEFSKFVKNIFRITNSMYSPKDK